MTTKTTIISSPIKRYYRSPNLKRRRITSPTVITISCEKQISLSKNLPDLLNDILIEQQRKKTIVNIATILRKVGDQMDEQLKINNTSSSSSNHIFGQRTITFVYCLSNVLRFFL